MKQTAVEWFAQELYEKFEIRGYGILYNELLQQAKQMEKQQITDAWEDTEYLAPEQYYNETFKPE